MRNQGWLKRRQIGLAMWLGGGLLMAAPVRAATIVAYDGANSPVGAAATEVFLGVTPLDLTRGTGLNAGSGGTFNSSGWTDEAVDYLEWGWSASQPFDLTDLDLRYDRSASGPSVVDIQLAVNGGAFASIFSDASVDDAGEDVLDIDLTSFTGVTSAAFRLFGSSASSASGTFDIEPLTGVIPDAGIMVSGTVVPVPEPSAQAMAILAGLGLILACRRKR